MLRRVASCHLALRSTRPLSSDVRFGYGLHDFRKLREGKYWWRDTSAFIKPIVESSAPHQMLLRPPRFGKSAFCSMLHAYLDIQGKGKAKKLFAGTDIASMTTTNSQHRSKYHVMKFDFSIDIGDGSEEAVRRAFSANIYETVSEFAETYGLKVRDAPPTEMLKSAISKVTKKKGEVFLIIDEYDRFANKLMFERPEDYSKLSKRTEDDAKAAPLLAFFESVKAAGPRSFTTGITPIALADASGWNVCDNLTHDAAFDTVCGLRERDVREVLEMLIVNETERDRVFALMKRIYNGYHFPAEDGLSEPLFNTQMCLFFFNKFMKPKEYGFRDNVINVWSHDPASADIAELLDVNVSASEIVLRVVAKHRSLPALRMGLQATGGTYARVNCPIRLRELLDNDSPDRINRLATYMYHHGLVTLADPVRIKWPNRTVDDPLHGDLTSLSEVIKNWKFDVPDVINNPTSEKVWDLMSEVIGEITTKLDRNFKEVGLQVLLESALRSKASTSHTPFTVDMEYRYDCGLRADVRLTTETSVLIIELKRLLPASGKARDVVYVRPEVLSMSATYANDQEVVMTGGPQHAKPKLAFPRDVVVGDQILKCVTVEELRDNALRQAENYGRVETKVSPASVISVCSVIHWTQLLANDNRGNGIIIVSDVKSIPPLSE